MPPNPVTVAVVGATGAVGLEMVRTLEQRNFPVGELRLAASPRSVGRTVHFQGRPVAVCALEPGLFEGVAYALFSAGSGISRDWAPVAAKRGAVVIDNSSAWRMDPAVPLVVPEVNPGDLRRHPNIIANPNCSIIQLVVALKPLHDAARVRRVIVTTFQSVSGAGARAMEELRESTRAALDGRSHAPRIFPHPIAFNALPQIPQSDAFVESGYTTEEMKMVNETRKIMGDDTIQVTPTCVRVPVFVAHSESVWVELEKPLTPEAARELLRRAPGVEVVDDPARQQYPLATAAAGKDATFVGRIRQDLSNPKALNLWVVADNLRKGAALNAVQIAEVLGKM